MQSRSMPRAEAFVRAGEQWLLADDGWKAAHSFRMAMADGGPVDVDPRVPLCRALFQMGESAEAYDLIETLKSEGRTDPRACDMIVELLVEQSDLLGALDWADAGVELLLDGQRRGADQVPAQRVAADASLRGMLRLRYRIRNDLRLPEDEYDRMISDLDPSPAVSA